MVNEYTGDDVTTRVHEEQWLHQMLTINDPSASDAQAAARHQAGAGGAKAATVSGQAARRAYTISTGSQQQEQHIQQQQIHKQPP